MRRIGTAVTVAALVGFVAMTAAAQDRTVDLGFDPDRCTDCVEDLEEVLGSAAGVEAAVVSPDGVASITYDAGATSPEALEALMFAAGYAVGTPAAVAGAPSAVRPPSRS